MNSLTLLQPRQRVRAAIENDKGELIGLAHDIHTHPQLAYEEKCAAGRISEYLERSGFEVELGVYDMPTALIGTYGEGPLHLVFFAEYDALPPDALTDRMPAEFAEVIPVQTEKPKSNVHACGHNVIAGAAVAAATGLQDVVPEIGVRASVFGTPAEELIGLPSPPAGRLAPGKTVLVDAGAFRNVHAALMVHPFPTPYGAFIPTHTYGRQLAEFSRSSGAAGGQLDAAALRALETALSAAITDLRQSLLQCRTKPEDADSGGKVDILWLGPSPAEVGSARQAVQSCLDDAAAAHGVAVNLTEIASNAEMHNDPLLASAFRRNAEELGRGRAGDAEVQHEVRLLRNLSLRAALRHPTRLPGLLKAALHPPVGLFFETYPAEVLFGTDMGDVSRVIPAIHPFIGIGGFAAPHSAQFAVQADSHQAYRAMIDAGIALAWTAIDAVTDPTSIW
jgi:metal-dependent amidase/aminoacylase/carboxypeptidase family protein